MTTVPPRGDRVKPAALDYLRRIVEVATKDPETSDKAWRAYLTSLPDHTPDLAAAPVEVVEPLLAALAAAGRGWASKAGVVRRVWMEGRKARARRERQREAPTMGPGDPAVWALLATRGDPPKPQVTLGNLVEIFGRDETWRVSIRQNTMTGHVEVEGEPLTDAQVGEMTVWCEQQYGLAARSDLVLQAVSLVASRNSYHPVRDYLQHLQWDGRQRAPHLLRRYMGAIDEPGTAAIYQSISTVFLVSAVARALQPGCKLDTMLILYGEQGGGKSTALAALAGDDWFSDSELKPGDKDSYQQIQGVWIYEIGECETLLDGRSQGTVKRFLSSKIDRFRPPYGRLPITVPRSSAFVGTTNQRRFLADPTGDRRYQPVRVGKPDVEAIRDDRDQLWAEAVALFRSGCPTYLSPTDAALVSELAGECEEIDAWMDPLARWLQLQVTGQHSTSDILSQALGVPIERQGREAVRRVGHLLRRLGYDTMRPRDGTTSRARVWSRV